MIGLEHVSADNRDENGRFLHGNPGGGRPRIAAEIRELFEARSKEAVDGLWSLYEKTENDKLKARILTYWIDRIAGRPAQAIVGADGGPVTIAAGVDLSKLTPEQIEQLKMLLRAAR